MSGPIQVVPPGLLSLLQLTNEGKTAAEFLETLQPIIEMRDWYMQFNAAEIVDRLAPTVGAGLTGWFTAAGLRTADREWHYVDTLSYVSSAIAAASVFSARIGYRRTSGS